MKIKQLLAAFAVGSTATVAFAGQAADDAQTHFSAIAAGDVALTSRDYANNAMLEWIGGPLDGNYAGADKIREAWTKFTNANPNLKVTVHQLEESANPKGATVTANVRFEGKQPINVRYVLSYRDGKLVHETWQIDPRLAQAAAY
jgi:hypothetical protein